MARPRLCDEPAARPTCNGSAAAAERIAAGLAGETTDEVARRLRVLDHPTRIALLVELTAGARNVTELAAATGLDRAAASKHLCELQRASAVVRSQDGTRAIYAQADTAAVKVLLLVARTATALRVVGLAGARLADDDTDRAAIAVEGADHGGLLVGELGVLSELRVDDD